MNMRVVAITPPTDTSHQGGNVRPMIKMTKRFVGSCTILLVGLAAAPALSAQDENQSNIEGVWFTQVTPVNCNPPGFPFPTLQFFVGCICSVMTARSPAKPLSPCPVRCAAPG